MLMLAAVTWACDASDDAPAPVNDASSEDGTSMDGSSGDGGGGDDGGDGIADCFEDAECLARAEGTLAYYMAPQLIDPYIAGRCELAQASDWPCGYGLGNGIGEPACLCFTTVDPERFDLLSGEPRSCLVFGRDDTCLYMPTEFPGCDVAQPETSCTAICDDVQARRQAEAEMTMDGEVRYAACDRYNCEVVLRLADRCYYEPTLASHRSYDCALSDGEIIQMEKDRPLDCVDVGPLFPGE